MSRLAEERIQKSEGRVSVGDESEGRKIKHFTDLIAWQEGRRLVIDVYSVTDFFPQAELYGLVSQMKRAAVSVPSNIAEGFGRQTMKDKLHFYVMANGSIRELHTQAILAHDLNFLDDSKYEHLTAVLDAAGRSIYGLIKSTKERL